MAHLTPLLLLLLTFTNVFISGVLSDVTFTIENKCDYTVWPGALSISGVARLSTTGFALQKGESKTITAPPSWDGRFWGRTQCTQDSAGNFSCITADFGSGKLECSGGGGKPPATLAEFTLNGPGGMDFYDVSLVDGYNLPMLVVPQGGSGDKCKSTGCERDSKGLCPNGHGGMDYYDDSLVDGYNLPMLVVPQGGSGDKCPTTGCVKDLNGLCPNELQVVSGGGQVVACKSPCEAFGTDQYCCRGAFNTPETCKPSEYVSVFKTACPTAYSYAYDDLFVSSTFTCKAVASYIITFCPPLW